MSSKKNRKVQEAKPVQPMKNKQKSTDKKMWMRIVVLALAALMILGAIFLPLI